MNLKIAESEYNFLIASLAKAMLDFESKQPRVGSDGQIIYVVDVLAIGTDGSDILSVKVSGEPKGLSLGAHVKLTGLVATTWTMRDRSGVSFRAQRIDVLSAKSSASA
jgi:hypothetical protein